MDSAIVIHHFSYNMLIHIIVLVGMFASSVVDHGFQSVVDHGFQPRSDQAKDNKVVFAASLLSMQH